MHISVSVGIACYFEVCARLVTVALRCLLMSGITGDKRAKDPEFRQQISGVFITKIYF